MNVRVLAGVGMTLLAAGLLILYALGGLEPTAGSDSSAEDAPRRPAAPPAVSGPAEVDTFLVHYNRRYRTLWTAAEGGRFRAESDITPENTVLRVAADRDLAEYVGGADVVDRLRLLRGRLDLSDLQDRQIEAAWRLAARYPGTHPEQVGRLIERQAAAIDTMYSHRYRLTLPGAAERTVTPNELGSLLAGSRDPDTRRAVWECGKSVGPRLKDDLVELQGLRNELARAMGFSSYFGLETADYGLTAEEMLALMDDLVVGIMPLYQQLHCWVKHELAARYGEPVPVRLPAHWLNNPWAQSWPGVVEGVDMDALVRDVEPTWLIEQAERFYVSLGFPRLPVGFWSRSDLYELPADSGRNKNTHASAWHIDLDRDVRCLMSVRSDFDWFRTTHHELGHIYYYLAYSRPEVPPILREGANRGFHEGIGSLIELAATQAPYLMQLGLMAPDAAPDEIRWLLNQALTGPVVFLPFAAGTMTHFEFDLYEGGLARHQFNTRWWEYAGRYQGIAPPTERGEDHCDPATKTHIIDDPAQYYDYAVSQVLLHQLHRYICRDILDQDVRSANYYADTDVGLYLDGILRLGATRDWAQVVREATGEDLSSAALLEYFAPLQAWLEQENAGREVGF